MDSGVFKKAKHSFIWVFFSSVAFQVISWVMTILVVRTITPTDYGLFGILMIIMEYLGPFTHCNVTYWYVWKNGLTNNDICNVEILIIFLSSIVAVAVFISAPYVAEFFKHEELLNDYRLISIIFFLTGINKLSLMKFEKEINFKPISIINVSIRLLQGAITLTLAYLGYGYKALVYSLLVSTIIQSCILLILKKPVLLSKIYNIKIDYKILKEAMSYGMNITLGLIFWLIYTNSDNLVIGKVFGAEILGFYSLAFFFIDLPLAKLNEWIRPVLHPYFSKLKNEKEVLNSIFLKFVFTYLAVLAPAYFGIYSISDEFVYFVLGNEWKGSVIFLKLLAAVGLFRVIADLIDPYMKAVGLPQYGKYANMIGAMILPISFYLGSIYFGINAIFYTWILMYPIVPIYLVSIFSSKSKISIYLYLKSCMPGIFSAAIMAFIIYLADIYVFREKISLYIFIFKIILGFTIYTSTMFVLFRNKIMETKYLFSKPQTQT